MGVLWLDRETWSEADLKEVGTYVYAETAEDLLVAYSLDDGAVRVWDRTAEELHDELYYAMQDADEVWAHNAQFDKAIHNGPAQSDLPRIELERWRCSMALAMSHALPGKLDNLCQVLRVPSDMSKIKEGTKLIQLFCKPQAANRKVRRPNGTTHPTEWARFKDYAAGDVVAMRECARRIPRWNWDVSAIAEWHLDQRINERGFQVDRQLTKAGARAAVVEKERIGVRFRQLTGGVVDRPSQRAQFMALLNDRYALGIDNTQSDTFNQLMKNPLLEKDCVELMKLSIASNKTSTAKYAALDPAVCKDGRFRGGLQFAGASRTRRWAGRMFQPQNLPSRGLPKAAAIESYIEHLKAGSHDLWFDNLMLYGAAALRGIVVVPPKKKMVVADLSNIEGRVLAWVAGEQWKLQAFRDYDAGTGPDLYNITAVSIIGGDPWKVAKVNRNVFGKVPDLASGYMGGVAGYQTFAHAYGVRMQDYWETIQAQVAPQFVEQAKVNLEKWGRAQLESLEINELEWIASETCKLAWRARHPATVKFWYALQEAAISAIKNWGQVFTVGPHIKVRCVSYMGQKWMVVRLPSGRMITYFEPHLVMQGGTPDHYEEITRADGTRDVLVHPGRPGKPTIAYYGEAAEEGKTTRQWVKVFTHGGKMTGNVCQTIARDVLAPALQVAENQGYLPILSVHDEGLTEVPDTPEFNTQGLVSILSQNSDWNQGLPLAAAGFEAYRYKKED